MYISFTFAKKVSGAVAVCHVNSVDVDESEATLVESHTD